jgi:hypothetical protein
VILCCNCFHNITMNRETLPPTFAYCTVRLVEHKDDYLEDQRVFPSQSAVVSTSGLELDKRWCRADTPSKPSLLIPHAATSSPPLLHFCITYLVPIIISSSLSRLLLVPNRYASKLLSILSQTGRNREPSFALRCCREASTQTRLLQQSSW